MPDFPDFLTAFAWQCEHSGTATALVHGERSLSYRELDDLSDQIASSLLAKGIKSGAAVAFLCERSFETIASMIAAFKLDAAFVPIDPVYPDDRIRFILDDVNVSGIVADNALGPRLAALNLSDTTVVQWINDDSTSATEHVGALVSAVPAVTQQARRSRAYIMYTSGSTGKPKGVVINQNALACYCKADIHAYQLTASDRTLQFSTLSFDIAVEEIFPPLWLGGTVVLRPPGRSDAQIELSDLITRYDITALHLATGYWHEWVDLMTATASRVPASLRLMVVTGEKVSPEHYFRWRTLETKPALWANAYGPTEATVSATVFVPPPRWKGKSLPIGKPLMGYQAYILDDTLKAVDASDTGELYIGGDAVSSGYLNREELNATVFLPDPFSPNAHARMYKTGDLARWREDGNIDYAGRIDHQIKLGSYRVEPGEVENTINTLSGVAESLVMVASASGKSQLIAYVAIGKETITEADVADHLKSNLPVHMLPGLYVLMEALPKTINGKVDRTALPDLSKAVVARRGARVDAQNDTEQQLCAIWCDVLGLPDVSTEDSFISLGGDSLMAVKTIARIQSDMGYSFSTRDFFFLDTIALLAGHIQGKQAPKLIPAPQPAFINLHGRQIYTVLQRPAAHNDNGRGILLVPPVGNEQRRTQRPFRSLMQNLSRQGYTLMRFDWYGTGNSTGTTVGVNSLQPWIDDVQDVAQSLAGHVGSIDVVALRLGALMATCADTTALPIRQTYLWDPVLSGGDWLQSMQQLHHGVINDSYRFLRPRKPSTGDVKEYVGLALNEALHENLRNTFLFNLLADRQSAKPVQLIVPGKIAHELETWQSASGQDGCEKWQVHEVDEDNEWINPRATNRDMIISKAAAQLYDLLEADNSDEAASVWQRATA